MGILSGLFTKKHSWDKACAAEKNVYEKDDGTLSMSFTFTEAADTILPMDPANMYETEQAVGDYRLCFVCARTGEVVDDLPFYACIPILADYVLEQRKPYVLICGLRLEEMRELCARVRQNETAKQRLREKFKKNLEFLKSAEMCPQKMQKVFAGPQVTVKTFEDIGFSSGEIIAADPICYLSSKGLDSGLVTTIGNIPAGVYPVSFGILRSEEIGIRMTGMKVSLKKSDTVQYERCETGIAVDAGMITLCDAGAVKSYCLFEEKWYEAHPDQNFYDDYLDALFKASYREYPDLQRADGDFICFRIPDSEDKMIMVASGFGDGYYPVYIGYDANHEMTEVATVFIDPDIFD